MNKLQFTSSVAAQLGNRRVSVPALPYKGRWCVARISEYHISVTHVETGIAIVAFISNRRVGRIICAVLDALDYDLPRQAEEFKQSPWYEWIRSL